ncbi:MAG: DUF4836 family protein [Bacteroidaceae bacterium]|nr:DUF4836 family protein [Bacteroidaceae bacterium]
MKKYGLIAVLVALLGAGVWAWLYLRSNIDDMADSLPADLTMVGRWDLKRAMAEYGIEQEKVEQFVEELGETGIDYTIPGYVFAVQGYLGAIVPLDDDAAFENFLLKKSHPTQRQRGMKWSGIDGKWIIGYDENRAMIMGPALGAELDNLRNTIAQCMHQRKGDSGKKSPLYAILAQCEEPIAMAGSLQLLCNLPAIGETLKPLAELPINLTMGFHAEKKRLNLSLTLMSENANANKFFDQLDEAFRPINGSLVTSSPSRPFLHLEAGVNGERLLAILRENPDVCTKLLLANTLFDADLMLKNISGDLALSMPAMAWLKPAILLQVEMKSMDFLDNVVDWNDEFTQAAGVRFAPSSPSRGEVQFQKGWGYDIWKFNTLYYGTKDHTFRLSTKKEMAQADAHTDLLREGVHGSQMKGCRLYAQLNIGELMILSGQGCHSQQLVLKATDARHWFLELPDNIKIDLLNMFF